MASIFSDLETKTDRWELMVGYDATLGTLHAVAMDSTTRTLAIQNWVWNTSTLAWEKMKQPNFQNTGDIYIAVDDLEQYTLDNLSHFKMARFDVSGNPLYVGMLDKNGLYYIKRINTSTGVVDYTSGSSGFSTAWTNRASESYADFDSTTISEL